MSAATLMDTMKAESDFCSICLRTKIEVKLDSIPTKMYQMFFVQLVKCKEPKKDSRSICFWCRRRVLNALKLVETAQKTDRILVNITQTDKSHSQLSEHIVWDQIQANKRKPFLIPRTSQVISYSLPPDKGLVVLPVKLECEDGISSEKEKASPAGLSNDGQSRQIQPIREMSILTPRTSEVISCNVPRDAEIDLSAVKQELDDEITIEEENVWLEGIINEDEVDREDRIALERNNLLTLRLESDTDDESTSQLDMRKNTSTLREYRNQNKKRKLNELVPAKADGNQDLLSEKVKDNSSSESQSKLSKKTSEGGESTVEIENSDANSQVSSTAEALKYIRLLRLTKDQELEERKQDESYDNTPFKCEPCILGLTMRGAKKKEKHSEDPDSRKCTACSGYVKPMNSNKQKSRYDRYACMVCGFYFSSMQVALEHYLSQHANQWHKCEHCSREFRNTSGLKIHVRRVHNAELPFFSCKLCSLVLNTTFALNQHVAQHNRSKSSNLHHCKSCFDKFSSAFNLSKHKCTNSRKEKFVCEVCGDVFKQLSMLQEHNMKSHFDVSFECDHCKKTFLMKRDLRMHIKYKHLQVMQDKSLLVQRKPESLIVNPENMCNQCGQRFSRSSHLVNHLRSHSTARPYPCTICSATYKHSIRLERHMRLMHKVKK